MLIGRPKTAPDAGKTASNRQPSPSSLWAAVQQLAPAVAVHRPARGTRWEIAVYYLLVAGEGAWAAGQPLYRHHRRAERDGARLRAQERPCKKW